MQCFILSCWTVLLLCQITQGIHSEHILGNGDLFDDTLDSLPKHFQSSTSKSSNDISRYSNDSSESNNSISDSESSLLNGSSSRTEQVILRPTNVNHLLSAESFTTGLKDEYLPSTSEVQKLETLTQISNNESFTQSKENSSTESSSIVNGNSQYSNKSTLIFVTPGSVTNQSTSSDEEPEGVIIVKPLSPENGTIIVPHNKTMYQRALEIINDAYILSIVVPVAAGIMFATTIIVTIAACRCLRRSCRRRRIRRNAKLPDSVKSLRPSDSARLLAESSDEEF